MDRLNYRCHISPHLYSGKAHNLYVYTCVYNQAYT